MGANGLDDYSPERIGDYAEGYGYIHENNVQALRKALEEHGYTVLTASRKKSTQESSIDVEKLKASVVEEFVDARIIHESNNSSSIKEYAYGRMCAAGRIASLLMIRLDSDNIERQYRSMMNNGVRSYTGLSDQMTDAEHWAEMGDPAEEDSETTNIMEERQ